MWRAPRISTLGLQRPTLSTSILSPSVRFRLTSAAAASQVSLGLKEESVDFLSWLQQKAGIEISTALSLGNSIYATKTCSEDSEQIVYDHLWASPSLRSVLNFVHLLVLRPRLQVLSEVEAASRSLFASRFIQAGECILQVPQSVELTAANIHPKVSSFSCDEVGSNAQLAVVILAEQKLGKDSEWAPYISCLPQSGELHSTIFWTKDELEMVQTSRVYQETINHKDRLEKEYLKVKPALERFHQIFGEVTIDSFMHAYGTVASRAWKSTKGLALVPFADFLNHNGISEAFLLRFEDEKISKVIADRDYATGEEVLISYGKFPNSTLILDFGFTVPFNIYDQVQVWMTVPDHDPLRTLKLELLHEHSMTTTTPSGNGVNSGNLFTIKEVKSAKGKGKGIPQALRAFARVLSSTSAKDLNDLAVEAVQTDGRLARQPLKDRDREIIAHQMLLSKISDLISEHAISIESFTSTDSGDISYQFLHRMQMAKDLLKGELRVLQSASAWLLNYCAALSRG